MLVVVTLTGQSVYNRTRIDLTGCVERRLNEVIALAIGGQKEVKVGTRCQLSQNLHVLVAHANGFVDEDDLCVNHVLIQLILLRRLVLAQDHHLVGVVDVGFHQSLLLEGAAIHDVNVLELSDGTPDFGINLVSTAVI